MNTEEKSMARQNQSLSIPPKRLAGNATCLNCGTELQGPFCHYCGQPDKNFMRFFPVLIRELMEDFLDFDSRFMRTLKPLLFRPGKLTRDYLDGRRFRYTPPLRLYIFASIAFLTVAALLTNSAVEISVNPDEAISQEDFETAKKAIEDLDPEIRKHIKIDEEDRSIGANLSIGKDAEPEAADTEQAEGSQAESDDDWNLQFNDERWDRETNPLIIPLVPNWINDWINDEIAKSPDKSKQIEENPNLIVDKVFDVLPATLFILLPLAALILKFWYLFARRYYIEHLIFSLHNHSFLFVVFLASMLANALNGWIEPDEQGYFTLIVFSFNMAILTWIPIYFLLSLKRVYQQGWLMTLSKYVVVSISYFTLLIIITTVVALLSFLLL